MGLGWRLICVASTEMAVNFCLELLQGRDVAEIFCKFLSRFSSSIQNSASDFPEMLNA